MTQHHKVMAFAISGFAGATNPSHELAVKHIIEDETGMSATCGHQLSTTLDFTVRATTAMLNARIIPLLTRLLNDLSTTLTAHNLTAPIVVVKGDGTLVSENIAREMPVETIFSGPAASVAGASFLTGINNALVVDMGGTTSDTALIEDGNVRLSNSGAVVGAHQTHVKALDIRTIGLGGDSLISWKQERFRIGPKRVAPIAWLGANYQATSEAIDYLARKKRRSTSSSINMDIAALSNKPEKAHLRPVQQHIVELLSKRPYSIEELIERTGVLSESGLYLNQLEDHYFIQRCGITPTDLLHCTGAFTPWSVESAHAYCSLIAGLSQYKPKDMMDELLTMVTETACN